MKVLVLGGCGRQGRIIAEDLKRKHTVITADVSDAADIKADLSDYKVVRELMSKYDLAVGALPSALGLYAMMAAVDSSTNYVDLSFLDHDVAGFNSNAMHNQITIMPDCGIAPGLSHLVAGRAIHLGADDISISVGGVAAKPEDDYVITWSPEDLKEEYTRPARIVLDGEVKKVPALSGELQEVIPGIANGGHIRGFYTDGLRSLLSKAGKVKRMEERTLRWPGHLEKVGPLIYEDNFAERVRGLYSEGTSDVIAMRIRARWTDKDMSSGTSLIVYGDENMSAMARATALACSAFTQLLASGKYKRTGIVPPEDVAMDLDAYKFILDCMAEHNVIFDEKYPFEEAEKWLSK